MPLLDVLSTSSRVAAGRASRSSARSAGIDLAALTRLVNQSAAARASGAADSRMSVRTWLGLGLGLGFGLGSGLGSGSGLGLGLGLGLARGSRLREVRLDGALDAQHLAEGVLVAMVHLEVVEVGPELSVHTRVAELRRVR